jgi:hypothetical protein
MSEHAWVRENVASYLAGGLEPAERDRLERHAASCEPCAGALAEERDLDRTMDTLFAAVRPEPALEDRLIQSLRAKPLRNGFRTPVFAWIGLSAAALLFLGLFGLGVSTLIEGGDLLFPGAASSARTQSRNDLKLMWSAGGLVTASPAPVDAVAMGDGSVRSVETKLETPDDMAQELRQKELAVLDGTSNTVTPAPVGRAKILAHQPVLKDSPADGEGRPVGGSGVPARMGGFGGGRRALQGPVSGGGGAGGEQFGLGFSAEKPVTGAMEAAPAPSTGLAAQNAPGTAENGRLEAFYSYRNAAPGAPAPPGAGAGFSPDGKKLAASENYNPTLWGAQGGKAQGQGGPAAGAPGKDGAAAAGDRFKPGEVTFAPPKEEGDKSGSYKDPKDPNAQPKPAAEPGKPADNKQGGADAKKPDPAAAGMPRKIIIRSGEIEFEVESFDPAVATITKLVNAIKGGFVATVNSEKLANGKVRGSVVVRVPPEALDGLVLDLRKEIGKAGELKGLRIGSQDITKQYTDLESRLRAARAMEERLLAIIKSGKGEIKDLLAAEKELGAWRTKIEELEGELRYYANLAALSTLTITLAEKEIRAPYAVVETERVQMGIEVEDVDKALREALKAVADAKGRVTKSELKQHAAGQFNAVLHFEVAPDAAGTLRDRLKQLGVVARLEIDRLEQTEGGTGKPQDAKTRRKDTLFLVSLYNLANVAPRETVQLKLAAVDAEATYRAVLARVDKAAGSRVVTSNINRQRSDQTRGDVQFEVKSADAEAVLTDLKELGEVMHLQTTENADTANTTRSKRGFIVQIWALGTVQPRETVNLTLAAKDVPASYRLLQDAIAKAKGRILNAQLNEQDKQNITGELDFDVRRTEEAAVNTALGQAGDVFSRTALRAQDSENVVDSKVLLRVKLINLSAVPPRETHVLAVEVRDVDQSAATISAFVSEVRGRTVLAQVSHERSGRVTAKLVYDVPLSAAPSLVDRVKGMGTVRVQQSGRNPQVPDSELATARIDVTLSNAELIVAPDEGLWPSIRQGLMVSIKALSISLMCVIIGVLFVLPWALVIYAIYRVVMRLRRPPVAASPAA